MTPEPGLAHVGSVCSACARPILWAVTAKGKFQPLDPEPDDAGNLRLLEEWVATRKGALQRVVVVKPGATLEFGDTGERWMPHHATCPNVEQFRRPA